MTHTHPTPHANGAPRPGHAPPLTVLPDQPEKWSSHGKAPLTWDEARERVAAEDASDGARTDLAIGDLSTWLVGPGPEGVACLTSIPLPGRPNPGLIPMRRSAFRHTAEAIKAPADYLLSLPAKLATACISTGLAKLDPKHTAKLLRLAGGQARAVASDSYAPLDNALVLDLAERSLRAAGMLADVRVTDLAVGTTLSMRVVLPGEEIAVRKGDAIQHGFDLLNGEVLNRAASLSPVTYRLICTNGMRRWEAGAVKRWTHRGDAERLREGFADALPVVLADARGLRDRMATALDRLVDDALGEIEGLSAFGFNQTETRAVARDLFLGAGVTLPTAVDQWRDAIQGVTVSVFDVANAVTHVAQSRGVDDRLTWEAAGGAYLLKRTV